MDLSKLCGIAAGVLIAAMPVSLLPCAAAETYSYTLLDDGTASLKCEDAALVHADIPETIDGHTVTTLAENCFNGCTQLETVTIPDSVTTIYSYAFQGCSMLETIAIPQAVAKIEDFAFEGCLSLQEITVADGNETYYAEDGILFKDGISRTLVRYPQSKTDTSYKTPDKCGTISPWAFTDCRYLEKLEFTKVSAIGADVCMNCTALQKVTICDDVPELIGAGFAYCSSLRSVKLPERLTQIGDRCFFGDAALSEINFPAKLESVGEQAFYACVELKTLPLPKSIKTLGSESFGYSVNESGASTKIPGVVFEVDFGSAAYKYAKSNGFSYKSEAPQSLILIIVVGAVLAILMIAGISISVKRQKAEKAAEAERLALEQRRKAHEERKCKKKEESGK